MFRTLRDVPMEKRVEMPVAEDMQLGMCTGISLAGGLPISIYPRWNFLLLATSQLVLHLDKISLYSAYKPKVIIRTAVACDQPLNPGPQHLGNFGQAYREMLTTVRVWELDDKEKIMPFYRWALEADHSTVLVEYTSLYE